MRTVDIEKKIRKNKLIQSFEVWKELTVFNSEHVEIGKEKFLIEEDVRTVNQILFYAGQTQRFDILKKLFQLGVNVNMINIDTDNHLTFEAVTSNNYPLLQFLQKYAPNLFSRDETGDNVISEVFSIHVKNKLFFRVWRDIFKCIETVSNPHENLDSMLNQYHVINKDYNHDIHKLSIKNIDCEDKRMKLLSGLMLFECSDHDLTYMKEKLQPYFYKNSIQVEKQDLLTCAIYTLLQKDNNGISNIEYLLRPENKAKFYYLEKKLNGLLKFFYEDFFSYRLDTIAQSYHNFEVQLYLNGNMDLMRSFDHLTNDTRVVKLIKI